MRKNKHKSFLSNFENVNFEKIVVLFYLFLAFWGILDLRYVKCQNQGRIKFLSKSLLGEPTWFWLVHPNLDPTLGVARGVKGIYRSMWKLKVGGGPR